MLKLCSLFAVLRLLHLQPQHPSVHAGLGRAAEAALASRNNVALPVLDVYGVRGCGVGSPTLSPIPDAVRAPCLSEAKVKA